jgi:hypothetical protein
LEHLLELPESNSARRSCLRRSLGTHLWIGHLGTANNSIAFHRNHNFRKTVSEEHNDLDAIKIVSLSLRCTNVQKVPAGWLRSAKTGAAQRRKANPVEAVRQVPPNSGQQSRSFQCAGDVPVVPGGGSGLVSRMPAPSTMV